MRHIAHPRVRIGLGLLALLWLGPVACDDATVTRDQVFSDYEAGRYEQAYTGSDALAHKASGVERDRLALVAGLSAYRLGRDDDALRHLKPLTSRGDDAMAGRAGATAGLIYVRRGRDELAASTLSMAATRLTGNDQAMAYYHAATAQQRLGRWASAKPNLTLAAAFATDPALRAAIRRRQRTDSFAVQFGAFESAGTANALAQTVRRVAIRAGLGVPAVVTSVTERGKTLYLVQAGRFTARGPATEARRRTGISSAFVVPAVSSR